MTLTKKADGTYEYNGVRVRSGSLVRSPTTQTRYRLRFSNGVWTASLYVPPIPGGGDTGVDTPPAVSQDILSALPKAYLTEAGAFDSNAMPIQTRVGSVSDDFSAYQGGGRYEDDTFVEGVVRAINRILGPIEAQGLADGTDSERFVAGVLIDSYWKDVQNGLNMIFRGELNSITFTKPIRSGGTDVDESVSQLEDLRDDLSDVADFKDRFKTQIERAGATGDKIFEARKHVLALGASTNTPFRGNFDAGSRKYCARCRRRVRELFIQFLRVQSAGSHSNQRAA